MHDHTSTVRFSKRRHDPHGGTCACRAHGYECAGGEAGGGLHLERRPGVDQRRQLLAAQRRAGKRHFPLVGKGWPVRISQAIRVLRRREGHFPRAGLEWPDPRPVQQHPHGRSRQSRGREAGSGHEDQDAPRRPFSRQALQLAKRPRAGEGRIDLVHRPAVRAGRAEPVADQGIAFQRRLSPPAQWRDPAGRRQAHLPERNHPLAGRAHALRAPCPIPMPRSSGPMRSTRPAR